MVENKREIGGRLSRRRFIHLAGISAAGVWLAACAAAPAQPAADAGGSAPAAGAAAPSTDVIDIGYMMNNDELTPAQTDQFHEANPGITITRQEPDATKYF